MRKVGGAQTPRFQVGGARAPKAPPPRSYVPGKEVHIFFVDAVPINLQDLKDMHSCFLGRECLQIFEKPLGQISSHAQS